MSRIEARCRNANAFRLRLSQSLASLRQRLSQASVRSTIQRLDKTTNPLARSERLTISTFRCGWTLASGTSLRAIAAGRRIMRPPPGALCGSANRRPSSNRRAQPAARSRARGKIQSPKSVGWDETRVFLEGDKLEVAMVNGRWVLTALPKGPAPAPEPVCSTTSRSRSDGVTPM